MCKFRAVKSKTEGMAASVRVFLNTPRISQGVKRGLAIQMGQTVPNFYRKKIKLLFLRLVASLGQQ